MNRTIQTARKRAQTTPGIAERGGGTRVRDAGAGGSNPLTPTSLYLDSPSPYTAPVGSIEPPTRLGRLVQSRRRAHGLSMRRLALKAGLNVAYIWKIERGEARNLTVRAIDKLSRALLVAPATMFYAVHDDLTLGDPR